MDVDCDVVRRLRREEGEQRAHRLGDGTCWERGGRRGEGSSCGGVWLFWGLLGGLGVEELGGGLLLGLLREEGRWVDGFDDLGGLVEEARLGCRRGGRERGEEGSEGWRAELQDGAQECPAHGWRSFGGGCRWWGWLRVVVC